MKKWYEVKASAEAGENAVIDIYDEIGAWGVTAKDFSRDMKAVLAKDAPPSSLWSPSAVFCFG